MSGALPPYPTGDLRLWATQLVEYILDKERSTSGINNARPVFLQHMTGDERALEDGILMFDPVLNKPVVSLGGAWVALETVP
jgi:hypothetical protein